MISELSTFIVTRIHMYSGVIAGEGASPQFTGLEEHKYLFLVIVKR